MFLKEFICLLFSLIVGLGIVGNLINGIVFARRKLWKNFTFKLIFYLSMLDLIILIACALESFAEFQFKIDIRILSTVFCKVDTFLAHFLLHARTILLLAILINSNLYIYIY
jgi:hypothetical protein